MKFEWSIGAAAMLFALAASPASAQTLIFPDTEIGGVTFSGLSLTATATRGNVEYQVRCIATAPEPGIEKKLEISFLVLGKNGKVLKRFGTAITAGENRPTDCHSGSGAFPSPGQTPEKMTIDLVIREAQARRVLVLKPAGLPNFEDASIDGLTFSALQLVPLKESGGVNYQVACTVTGAKNVIRAIERLDFFVYESNGKVPFDWIAGPAVSVRNGIAQDCHTGTGAIPDSGRTAAGMAVQYIERLAQRSLRAVIEPVGK